MISGRNRGRGGARLLPAVPARVTQGSEVGAGVTAASGGGARGPKLIPARVLCISQRAAGSEAAPRFPGGPSRIAAGARDFDGGGVVAAWQRQGAASPSALPLSAAVARADLAAAPRAARIHASREPTPCAHLARWGEAARAGTRREPEVGARRRREAVGAVGVRGVPAVGARRRREAAGEVRWCERRRRGLREPGALPGQDSAQGPWGT